MTLLFTQRERRSARGQNNVIIYNRSAMGICYLHSGRDETCKKCCNLHGIREVARQIYYLEAIMKIYKSDNPYHYGGLRNNNRIWRLIGNQRKWRFLSKTHEETWTGTGPTRITIIYIKRIKLYNNNIATTRITTRVHAVV